MKKTVILIFINICTMAICNADNLGKGLCTYNYEKKEFTVEQDGKIRTITGSKILSEDPSYHYTYVVQNNFFIYQTLHDLYVLHFDKQGEVASEFSIRNETYSDAGVALYGDVAITTGRIKDSSRNYHWNYGIYYVDIKSQTVQTVNLKESFGSRYAEDKFGATIEHLTVFGNTLYLLVEMKDFESSGTIVEYFIMEYDLEKRTDRAKRITPVDISAQAFEKDNTDKDRLWQTSWKIICMGSSEKYFVLALRSSTWQYIGESVGYMGSVGTAYLVYDRKTMQAIAFYPFDIGFVHSYAVLAIDNETIYTFDRDSCTLYSFDMEQPATTNIVLEKFGAINTYPAVGVDIVKTGFKESIAASGTKAHRSHFSISNGTLFYIAKDIYGKSFIDSIKFQE